MLKVAHTYALRMWTYQVFIYMTLLLLTEALCYSALNMGIYTQPPHLEIICTLITRANFSILTTPHS